MPGYDDGQQVTNQTERITTLWVGSWIAALFVGVVVWGLIVWCVTVYRKRKDDDVLPIQLRYHVPLEIMYTVVPILMVGVLFYYTARDMSAIEDVTTEEPDVVVEVYAKQWSWDFNYLDDDVWDSGVHVEDIGAEGNPETLPTLYLPVDQRVEFHLRSRDVIHSFWVPAFLYKKDMFPQSERTFQVVPTREGVYAGKCAEFCGEHHSGMLFNVAVVSQDEYDEHIESLRDAGQTGRLGPELDRLQSRGDDNSVPTGESGTPADEENS
ncbi:cytochrome c oxidase subunit II [Cellulomonas carbonis]|nr:cytochrome c oxidase subunit II [Cellulomonas carbonis]